MTSYLLDVDEMVLECVRQLAEFLQYLLTSACLTGAFQTFISSTLTTISVHGIGTMLQIREFLSALGYNAGALMGSWRSR